MSYPAKTKAKARALYESGNYSLRELETKIKVNLKTLADWSDAECWVKGKNSTKLQQIEQSKIEQEAAKSGITKSRVFAKLNVLMEAESLVIPTKSGVSLVPLSADKIKNGKGRLFGKAFNAVPDRKTQLAATSEAARALDISGEVAGTAGAFSYFRQRLAETRGGK